MEERPYDPLISLPMNRDLGAIAGYSIAIHINNAIRASSCFSNDPDHCGETDIGDINLGEFYPLIVEHVSIVANAWCIRFGGRTSMSV